MTIEETVAIKLEARVDNFTRDMAKSQTALRNLTAQLKLKEAALASEANAARLNTSTTKAQQAALDAQVRAVRVNIKELNALAGAERAAAASAGQAAGATNLLNTATSGLKTQLLGLGSAFAGAFAVGNILKIADEYSVLQGRLRLATKATGDYALVSRELNTIAVDTGTKLEDLVQLYQRTSFSQKSLGASSAQLVTATKAIAQTLAISGQSGESARGALLQLAQALGSGVIQAEEFNSILDGLPDLTNRIAAGFGLTPPQLKRAIVDGKVLSSEVLKVILAQAEDIDKQFSELPDNIKRSGTSLGEAFGQLIGEADSLLNVTRTIGEVMLNVAKLIRDNKSQIQALPAIATGVTQGAVQAIPVIGGPISAAITAASNLFPPTTPSNVVNKQSKTLLTPPKIVGKLGPGTGKTKKKTGPSLETLDNKEIQAIVKRFNISQSAISTLVDLDTAKLGPFPSQAELFRIQREAILKQGQNIKAARLNVSQLQPRSAEGRDAQSNEIDNLTNAFVKNRAELTKLVNENAKYETLKRQLIEATRLETAQANQTEVYDREIAAIREVRERRQQDYQLGLTQAKEYYADLIESINQEKDVALKAADLKIEALKLEQKQAQETNDENRLLRLGVEVTKAENAKLALQDDFVKAINEAQQAAVNEQIEIGKQIGETIAFGLNQALTQSFQSLLQGDLKGALTSLTTGFGNIVTGIFSQIFTRALQPAIASIAKGFQSGGLGGAFSSLGGLLKTPAGRFGGGALGLGIAASGFSIAQSGTLGGIAGGSLLGAGGGALAGLALGGPIGAGIGAVVGGIGSLFGGFGSRRRRQQEQRRQRDRERREQQRQQRLIQEQQRLQRQQEIFAALDQFGTENIELSNQFSINAAEPFKAAVLERQFSLEALARDTQRLISQYQDSQDVITQIVAREANKRALIEQKTREQYKETAKTLEELFTQRDAIENRNVFTRAQTQEAIKRQELNDIDKQITDQLKALNEFRLLGIANQDIPNIGRFINPAANINNTSAVFNVTINESTNPEALTRALESFSRRAFGATII